jgi:hypothetical protein
MKILERRRPAFRQAVACLLVIALAALCAGCATTRQVTSIVAESNAAMLAAQLPDVDFGGDPATTVKPPDPAAISRRIDDFIAAHPDQKVAAGALRVRQAILLIVHGKYELARAAFADATELKTDRDKALKALSEPLIWWWEHSQATALSESQLAEGLGHLDRFDQELPKLKESPDIHDLLAEMRARIGLKRVTSIQLADGTKKKDAFVDVLNRYGAIFTTNDIAAIKSGNLAPRSLAISAAEKRRLRALAVIEKAKQPARFLRTGGQAVTLTDLNSDPAVRGFGELVLGP